tara:strand:+ start:1090 stop:1599 length:510 start_codon:yes stop_codon:yes gene_type:complete
MKKNLSKYPYLNLFFALPLLALGISACSSQQSVDFSVVRESNQCRIQNAGISQLSNKKDQEDLIKVLTGFSNSQTITDLELLFDTHLKTENLYLVSQGKQTSAGFGFNIADNTGSLIAETLTLPITLTSPDPSSMRAQVMTSPCLVLGINSNARFNRLIIDKLELKISN